MIQDIADCILFEDNHLVAVNKKPSQIVQGDKTGDIPLSELVKSYIKEKYAKPGEVFIGVVHRIDRPVSGVTLFARTSKALIRMNELMKKREIIKTYWAVVKQKPPVDEARLIHYLHRNTTQNKTYASETESRGSQQAELSYKILSKSDHYYLLEIILHTGRHHQIRAQLAAIGCPIKGDLKYGFPRSNEDASIHLHARKLEFIHPVQNCPVSIIADPPHDPVWDYFNQNQHNSNFST